MHTHRAREGTVRSYVGRAHQAELDESRPYFLNGTRKVHCRWTRKTEIKKTLKQKKHFERNKFHSPWTPTESGKKT
jgi:hypothetical protein